MINKQIQSLASSCLIDNISLADLIQFYFNDFITIANDINSTIEVKPENINEKNGILTVISELQKYYNKNIKNVDMFGDTQEIIESEIRQIKRLVKRLIK